MNLGYNWGLIMCACIRFLVLMWSMLLRHISIFLPVIALLLCIVESFWEQELYFFQELNWKMGSRMAPALAHLARGSCFTGLGYSWLKWNPWEGGWAISWDLCTSSAFLLCGANCWVSQTYMEGRGIDSAGFVPTARTCISFWIR